MSDLSSSPRVPLLSAFARCERGSVALIFGLLVIVMFAFVGGAVDFARYHQMRSAYQYALDGAAIAAARKLQTGGTEAEAYAVGQRFMEPVHSRYNLPGTIEFRIAESGVMMVGTASLSMPTSILRVVNLPKIDMELNNTARFGVGPDVELSLMLDVTGSMGGQKLDDLKLAVEDLINIVVQEESTLSKSRVALAPFSNAVSLKTKQFKAVTGITSSSYRRCVVERAGFDAYTDASPTSGGYLRALDDVAPSEGCKNGSEVFPLSRKKSDLKSMVRSLTAGGMTAGHLGTAWAWYLLSPSWSDAFETDEKPAPYSDLTDLNANGSPKLRKIAVLMTDGVYNKQFTAVDSTTQARNVCAEMKRTGIEIFTVGFEITDPSVVTTLQNCATSPSNYYEASDGSGLKRAFRDIALKSAPLRLSQ
jgi:Flp pilus assembly protein TadG